MIEAELDEILRRPRYVRPPYPSRREFGQDAGVHVTFRTDADRPRRSHLRSKPEWVRFLDSALDDVTIGSGINTNCSHSL
jgi:hypothetical protein